MGAGSGALGSFLTTLVIAPLLVAALLNGVLTLTVVGLVTLCVGAAGFGVVLRGWLG